MESEPKRSFDRLVDEAVRQEIIDAPTRRRLVALWLLHRWKKGMLGFYRTLLVLSFFAVLIACCYGARWVVESDMLRSGADTAGAGLDRVWNAIAAAWTFVGDCFAAVAARIGIVVEGVYFLIRDVFAFLADIGGFVLSIFAWVAETILAALVWIVRLVCDVAGVVYSWIAWVVEAVVDVAVAVLRYVHSVASVVFSWLYEIASGVFGYLYELAASAAAVVYDAIASAAAFLYEAVADALRYCYELAASALGFLFDAVASAARYVYGLAASAARFVYGLAASCFGFLYRLAADGAARALDFVVNIRQNAARWYWLSLASEGKIFALLGASLLADALGEAAARRERWKRLVKPAGVLEAALFSWMLGHIIELFAIRYWWDGLELASMGIWSVIPLFIAVMTRVRPLLYEGVCLVILLIHLAVFMNGVSGNVIVSLDVSIAVMLIVGADALKGRLGVHAAVLRYTAMGVIGFLFYCSGFIWDLPGVLELRAFARPGSLAVSRLFLVPVLSVAALSVVWSHLRKRKARNRNDALFSLLLLLTLLFSCFPTGILLYSISVGTLYNLIDGYNLSIFAGNVILVALLAWAVWFVWCLWLLVESSALNNGVMAQIAVTALLGSLETRYVEVVKNISVLAGLVVLPLMLVLILAEIRIIRRWLRNLEAEPVAALAGEGGSDGNIL